MSDIPKIVIAVETKSELSLASHIIKTLSSDEKYPIHIRNWANRVEVVYRSPSYVPLEALEKNFSAIRNIHRGDGEFIFGGEVP